MASWQTDAIIAAHELIDEVLPQSSLALSDRVRVLVDRCKVHDDLLAVLKSFPGRSCGELEWNVWVSKREVAIVKAEKECSNPSA